MRRRSFKTLVNAAKKRILTPEVTKDSTEESNDSSVCVDAHSFNYCGVEVESNSDFSDTGWAKTKNAYVPIMCDAVLDKLPAGQYEPAYSQDRGYFFSKKDLPTDVILDFSDPVSSSILNSVKEFWQKEDVYRSQGFIWKRGYLLYGPPGGGKSSIIHMMVKDIIARDGIVLYVTDPDYLVRCAEKLIGIEHNRKMLIVLEDIDSLIDNYTESSVLAVTDGILQLDNVIFVATTNYPERLDKRITNRPSRFDVIAKIDMPNEKLRRQYIENKLKDADEYEINLYVKETDGFSIAHIKELIIATKCMDESFDVALNRIRRMMDADPSSVEQKQSFGFT